MFYVGLQGVGLVLRLVLRVVLLMFYMGFKHLVSWTVENVRMRTFSLRLYAHETKITISLCRYMFFRWLFSQSKYIDFGTATVIVKIHIL